ncbi:IS1 family transposase [Shigella sonnei]|uniref:IS1 family transposase n=1 Tax=Shigella sonnei TaxID=624 RepID=UPI0025B4B110|nr:IS1 family transposase [Shigella sonnei]
MSGLNRASAGWFYAYDSLRKTVVAHVFGERTMATLGRLMSLLAYSALFDHGLASKFDQRFASIRSTGNLTFSTAF